MLRQLPEVVSSQDWVFDAPSETRNQDQESTLKPLDHEDNNKCN